MKKLKFLLAFIFLICTKAHAEFWNETIYNNQCLTVSTAIIININDNGLSSLALQLTVSSQNLTQKTFTNGMVSTGSITVTNNAALSSASFSIDGILLRENRDWFKKNTPTLTAKSISDAIMGNAILNTIVKSTYAGNVVFVTATKPGANNYKMTTSKQADLTLSATSLWGGYNADYEIYTPTITIVQHGFGNALQVRFSTRGVALEPLQNQTTYFVIRQSADKIKLALSFNDALNNNFIVLQSSTTSGGYSFDLTPLNFSGNPDFSFDASNDNINWFRLPISPVTYSQPETFMWNGSIDFKFLKIISGQVDSGCINLKLIGNGR